MLPEDIDKDGFLGDLLRVLVRSLQDTIGLENVQQFVAIAGSSLGDRINRAYCNSLAVAKLSRAQIAQVMIDFKSRIGGRFYVIAEDNRHIELGNKSCPFGERAVGCEGLCMMTTNVFGVIAAENTGYSRVFVKESIARGDPECRVIIHLDPDNNAQGTEFFATS